MAAEPDRGQAELASILANLSREICQPLDSLRVGLGRLVDQPARPLTEAERCQAQTMLTLCDDLRQLTRESLGAADPIEGMAGG